MTMASARTEMQQDMLRSLLVAIHNAPHYCHDRPVTEDDF